MGWISDGRKAVGIMNLISVWGLRVLWLLGFLGAGVWIVALVVQVFSRDSLSFPPHQFEALNPWEIPFPAITICSQVKYKDPLYSKILIDTTDDLENEKDDEKEMRERKKETVNMICNPNLLIEGNATSDTDQQRYIKEMAPKMDELISGCAWENNMTDCSKIFNETVTSEGLCFSFNTLRPDQLFDKEKHPGSFWTSETGYPDENVNQPFRWLVGGIRYGLRAVLFTRDDLHDHKCKGPLKGFTLQVHSPEDIPLMELGFIRVPQDQEILIGVEPVYTYEEGESCYKKDQRHLDGFRVYTRTNCQYSCLKRYMKRDCKCLPFWMQETGFPLCGPGSKACIVNASEVMSAEEGMKKGGLGCNCLPQCYSLKYRLAEVSQSPFYWRGVIKAYEGNTGLSKRYENYSFSRVSVYAKDIHRIMPESYQPVVIYKYGNPPVILMLTGLCILMYIGLLYHVSLRENERKWKRENDLGAPLTENEFTNPITVS